jgi:hypothetical protein
MGDEDKDWEIWIEQNSNDYTDAIAQTDIEYEFWDEKPKNNSITLNGGSEEMLRVAEDGFYIRGVRVEADDKEAKQVYEAFKQWLVWNTLTNQNN